MIEVNLGDVIEPRLEKVIPTNLPDFFYIGLEHIEAHTMRLIGKSQAGDMVSTAKRFYQGDVLYSRLRPYLNKVIKAEFDGLCSSEFIIFPPSNFLNSSFLKYRLNCSDFVAFTSSLNTGDRPRVDFNQISSFKFLLPSSFTQTRIVEKLEELFSDLDAGVAELKAAQKKLEQYRQSLLKAAVEGTLTARWRAERAKSSEPLETGAQLLERILIERRRRWEEQQLAKFKKQGKTPPKDWRDKYPEPVKPKTADLPELPEGWVWASLDMLGEIASGVAKGTKHDSAVIVREVPYLRVANVQRGFLDLSEVKTILATVRDIEELTLQNGDVLFNEGGDKDKLGRGWIWHNEVPNCIHQNHVFRMRPYLPELVPELVSHYSNTFGKTWFQTAGNQTTNLASINMTILRTFPIPVAPSEEQLEILNVLQLQLDVLTQQEQSIDLGLKQSAAQRQNILKSAFSGQLVPQDPNDEPASVLLERIRAEQEARNPIGQSRRRKG